MIEPKRKPGRPKSFPSLSEFVEKYLPKKMPLNWHHRLFYDILDNKVTQNKEGKMCLNTQKKINKNILNLAPRFHAKSQCYTMDYPLYRIYKNPNIRIIIVSANEEIAVSFNRAIMNQLENNRDLHKKFGRLVPFTPKRWGERAMIVERESNEKDPTLVAIGVGGKLISRRADIIICDDIIDLDTARTKQARAKTKEWFENVLLPILEDDGQLIVAGTVWYKDDIYDYLWKESNFDVRLKLKALIYNEKYMRTEPGKEQMKYLPYKLTEFPLALRAQDVFDEDIMKRYELYKNLMNGTLWTAKWDFTKLMEKKKNMTEGAFMRQYLNEPGSEEERLFKEKMLNSASANGSMKTLVRSWDNSNPFFKDYGHLVVAIGVDLAISKKSTADNSAIAVWGMDDRRNRYLLWLDFGRWSPEETKQRVLDAYYNYKPVKIRVENVSFQDMLRQEMAEENIPIEGFHTSGFKKFNESTGIAQISMLMEQNKIVIPTKRADKDSLKKVQQLLYEMATYTPDQHAGDILMASWFAIDVLRDFDNKLRDTRGYFPTTTIIEQNKLVRASHRVLLLNHSPRVHRFAVNSLVTVFRPVKEEEDFIDSREEFFMVATRGEKSLAYIICKDEDEIVAKIEGDLTALMFCNLLERAGKFFNYATIIVDRTGEGEAVANEMENRFYPNLMCNQPDGKGGIKYDSVFRIDSGNLPIAVDHTRQKINNLEVKIPDEPLVREMGEIISCDGDQLNLSFGDGYRFKNLAIAIWLLDNYETGGKKLYNKRKRTKEAFKLPYLVFK